MIQSAVLLNNFAQVFVRTPCYRAAPQLSSPSWLPAYTVFTMPLKVSSTLSLFLFVLPGAINILCQSAQRFPQLLLPFIKVKLFFVFVTIPTSRVNLQRPQCSVCHTATSEGEYNFVLSGREESLLCNWHI